MSAVFAIHQGEINMWVGNLNRWSSKGVGRENCQRAHLSGRRNTCSEPVQSRVEAERVKIVKEKVLLFTSTCTVRVSGTNRCDGYTETLHLVLEISEITIGESESPMWGCERREPVIRPTPHSFLDTRSSLNVRHGRG